jgi:hypothetical protein
MRASIAFPAALIALAATTLAVSLDDRSATIKRDPKNFRLYKDRLTQEQCIPGACGGNTVDITTITVHDDCNGGGCNVRPAPAPVLPLPLPIPFFLQN